MIESGILGGQQDQQKEADKIRSIARMELGETSGKVNNASEKRKTRWWNQKVQKKIKNKRKAKK